MNYVSIDNVTALAMTIVKGSDLADRNIWREWIYECVKDLGCSDNEIKTCVLYPHSGIAKLPIHCRQIIELSLFDNGNPPKQLLHQFRPGKTRIFSDVRTIPSASAGATDAQNQQINALTPVDVSNDEFSIHLGTNGNNVASILIRYFAYPIDEKTGMPLIREEDMMACVYYIRYMEALRADDNRSKIQQDQITYFQEADRARARKKAESMTFDKAKTLMKDMMRLLPINDLSKF